METAVHYKLKKEKAFKIVQDFQKIISNWQSVEKSYGISTSEIEQVKRAFAITFKF
jgi:uncharacterized protein YfbU (UPF0304 family)